VGDRIPDSIETCNLGTGIALEIDKPIVWETVETGVVNTEGAVGKRRAVCKVGELGSAVVQEQGVIVSSQSPLGVPDTGTSVVERGLRGDGEVDAGVGGVVEHRSLSDRHLVDKEFEYHTRCGGESPD
jgi:hypothetical protein